MAWRMFKRVKSKPAQRTRPSSPEQDANDAADSAATGEDSPSTLAIKLKNKVKRAKPKSRLSFGGDEEEVCVSIVGKNGLLTVKEGGKWGGLSGQEVQSQPESRSWEASSVCGLFVLRGMALTLQSFQKSTFKS